MLDPFMGSGSTGKAAVWGRGLVLSVVSVRLSICRSPRRGLSTQQPTRRGVKKKKKPANDNQQIADLFSEVANG